MSSSGVEELMAMGYSQTQATKAMEIAHGDLEQAVGFLLMGEQSRSGFDHVNESRRDPSTNLGSLPEQSGALESGSGNINDSFTLRSDNNYAPPPPNSSNQATPASSMVEDIMNMGYNRKQSEQALAVSHGDMDQAINFLLMGDSASGFLTEIESYARADDGDLAFATALQHAELSNQQQQQPQQQPQQQQHESTMYHASNMRSRANVPKMVATQSFLTIPAAGSFCTCVAASKFLNGGVMTADSIDAMMQGGIELYRKTSGNSEYSIEKVLKKFGKSNLKIEAVKGAEEPKNGVFMEQDVKHNAGLRKLLSQCRMEQEAGWEVILLETLTDSFCLCLAPKGSKNKFWYFDFTPRPMFRVPGAYARVHSSMLQLEESLESILKKMAEHQQKEFVAFALYTIKKSKG